MYTNIIYFLAVLFIFSSYTPGEKHHFTTYYNLFFIVISHVGFYLFSKNIFKRLEKIWEKELSDTEAFTTLHTRCIHRQTLIAIFFYFIFTYLFDLKLTILKAPFSPESSFLTNLLGITPFFSLLLIIWDAAFSSYKKFYHPQITKKVYLLSHLRINFPIVLPWLALCLIVDLTELVPLHLMKNIEDNPLISIIFFAALFILIAVYFPLVIVKVWGCQPIDESPLRRRLEDFSRKNKFACADMLLWNLFDGKLISAGVIGFVKRYRYILISPTLLKILNEDEIEAVLAHEIGHVKNRHMLFYVFFVVGFIVFAWCFYALCYYGILSQDKLINLLISGDHISNSAISLIITLLPIIFLLIYFRLLFGVFSRNFERQSDLYAMKLKGTNIDIISSLVKIAQAGSHNQRAPNWHHFSIYERINFLKKCEHNPALIGKHNRKVAKMIALYFVFFISMGLFLYAFNEPFFNQSEEEFILKILEKKIEKNPNNSSYHFMLANIYYEKHLLTKAESQYALALSLNPDDPEILNNLAWLYATSDIASVRKPKKALILAQKAAILDPKPYILDTLAECYFANGNYEQAIHYITIAISCNPENITYYKNQLKRFKRFMLEQRERGKNNDSKHKRYAI